MNRALMIMIKDHEGFRDKPYLCSGGKLTIGWGRNLDDVGLSKAEAEVLLANDIKGAIKDIKSVFPKFNTFSVNRQNALTDMMFNLGKPKFSGFENMITAIKAGDWKGAKAEAIDSDWHSQVGDRAVKIERLLLDKPTDAPTLIPGVPIVKNG